MITKLPQDIILNRRFQLFVVVHINRKEPHVAIYDLPGILEIRIIVFLQPFFCLFHCIISYGQPPVTSPVILMKKRQIRQLVISEIPSFLILLHMTVTAAVLVLMLPTFKSFERWRLCLYPASSSEIPWHNEACLSIDGNDTSSQMSKT